MTEPAHSRGRGGFGIPRVSFRSRASLPPPATSGFLQIVETAPGAVAAVPLAQAVYREFSRGSHTRYGRSLGRAGRRCLGWVGHVPLRDLFLEPKRVVLPRPIEIDAAPAHGLECTLRPQ